MWFDPDDTRCLYVDKRTASFKVQDGRPDMFTVNPNMVCDFTALPFPSNAFALVVFDPPHVIGKEWWKGDVVMKYGILPEDWRDVLRKGFAECFRVLKPESALIFKWASCSIPVEQILELTPEKPLFGHRTGKSSNTHWIAFLKPNDPDQRRAKPR